MDFPLCNALTRHRLFDSYTDARRALQGERPYNFTLHDLIDSFPCFVHPSSG